MLLEEQNKLLEEKLESQEYRYYFQKYGRNEKKYGSDDEELLDEGMMESKSVLGELFEMQKTIPAQIDEEDDEPKHTTRSKDLPDTQQEKPLTMDMLRDNIPQTTPNRGGVNLRGEFLKEEEEKKS